MPRTGRIALEPWLLALGFWLAAMASGVWQSFEIDPDEGLNFALAILVGDGVQQYGAIYSDQTPLWPHCLAWAIELLGPDGTSLRAVHTAFTALLIFCGWHVARRIGGPTAATLGALLLVALPGFGRFGVAVMTGVPAIALAMAATHAAVYARERADSTPRSAVALGGLAGVLLALSVLTKLFTAFVAGPLFIGLWLCRPARRAAWSFLAGFLLVLVVGLLTLGDPAGLPSLLAPHLQARDVPAFADESIYRVLRSKQILAVLALAAVGAWQALRSRSWPGTVLTAWLLLALALLWGHHPLWLHQHLLFTIPAVWLGGNALASVLRIPAIARLQSRLATPPWLTAVLAGIAAFVAFSALWSPWTGRPPDRATAPERALLQALDERRDRIGSVFTDRGRYLLEGRLPPLPEYALLSWKRLQADPTLRDTIRGSLEQDPPDAILLARFPWPGLQPLLQERYRLEVENEAGRLFLLR